MLLKQKERQSSVRHGGASRLGAPGHQQTFEGFIGCPADTSTDRFVKLRPPRSRFPRPSGLVHYPRLLNRMRSLSITASTRSVDTSMVSSYDAAWRHESSHLLGKQRRAVDEFMETATLCVPSRAEDPGKLLSRASWGPTSRYDPPKCKKDIFDTKEIIRRATTDGWSLEDGARVSVVRQKIVNDVIPRRAYQDYSLELDLRASRDQQVFAAINRWLSRSTGGRCQWCKCTCARIRSGERITIKMRVRRKYILQYHVV